MLVARPRTGKKSFILIGEGYKSSPELGRGALQPFYSRVPSGGVAGLLSLVGVQ
jgi:hypothetical protein